VNICKYQQRNCPLKVIQYALSIMSLESVLSHENEPPVSVAGPAVESLIENSTHSYWPEAVRKDPALREAAELRHEVHTVLDYIYSLLTHETTTIERALENGEVSETTLTTLYQSLARFLDSDLYHDRLALYLPFELLPHPDTTYEDPACQAAAERFRISYQQAWRSQLHIHDLRANFLDGDIPDKGPRARSVKAAHLAPFLVERGMLDVSTVLDILQHTDDHVLQKSLRESLSVLNDMGQVDETVHNRLSASEDSSLRELSMILRAEEQEMFTSPEHSPQPLSTILQTAHSAVAQVEAAYQAPRDDMSERRRSWLISEGPRQVIAAQSERLTTSLQNNTVSIQRLTDTLEADTTATTTRIITYALRGLVDMPDTSITPEIITLATRLHTYPDPSIQNDTESLLLHLYARGAIDAAELEQLDIYVPTIAATGPERLRVLELDLDEIGNVMTNLETIHPELATLIYPTALLIGSRTKGYAAKSSDLDIAVFARPTSSKEQDTRIQDLAREALADEKFDGKVMTYWLYETADGLWIRDKEDAGGPTCGNQTFAHPLRGMWCGDESAIRELHEQLLPEFLYSADKELYDVPAREVWHEELERETLQYRLMHKGYERLRPRRGGISTAHANAIDGQSLFYDSGYRRLATQLYIDRVFLPQLERPI
jgi:hypothetical protein